MRRGRTFLLVLLCHSLALLVFWAAYEVYGNLQYSRWRDDFGAEERITVASTNPELVWEFRPRGRYHGEFGDIVVNRFGFRDSDSISIQKPAGVQRIAFIGDSVTMGYRITPEETFVRQFEMTANAPGRARGIQALNFGIDGYDARQILELLRSKALLFEPDCIVYVMCLNDFDFHWSSGHKRRYFHRPRSFLFEKLEFLFLQYTKVDFHEYSFKKNHREVFEALRQMRELAEARHRPLLVALMPAFYSGAFERYPLREVHRRINQFLGSEGIRHIDLLDGFDASGLEVESVALDIWHPNARGHSIIAHTLQRSCLALLEDGGGGAFVPRPPVRSFAGSRNSRGGKTQLPDS